MAVTRMCPPRQRCSVSPPQSACPAQIPRSVQADYDHPQQPSKCLLPDRCCSGRIWAANHCRIDRQGYTRGMAKLYALARRYESPSEWASEGTKEIG